MAAYRMLNLLTQKVSYFDDFNDLVRFCASHNAWHRGMTANRYPWGYQDKPLHPNARNYHIHNSLLSEQVAMSPKETYRSEPTLFHKEGKDYRTLMFFDALDRVIDPRNFWDAIADYEPPKYVQQPYWKIVRKGQAKYTHIFRGNPVPHTTKSKGGTHATNVHTFQERKWADDEEHAPFVRGSRRGHNLPSSWDGRHRNRYKSWKHQGKKKRQWDR